MMKLLVLLYSIIIMQEVRASNTIDSLQYKLYKAEGFLHAKPTLTFDILNRDLKDIHQLKTQEQLKWLQTLLRASVTLDNLSSIESTSARMLSMPTLLEDTPKLVTTLSSLGIWLRKQGYLEESLALFDCALAQPITEHKQIISLKLSKGISFRNLGQPNKAYELYQSALLDAQKTNALVYEGAILNSLGVLALFDNNLKKAKDYFREALAISQETSRRSGQTIAGLNLMLIALIEDNQTLYNRLHASVSKLTLDAKNNDYQIYLHWLEQSKKKQLGKSLTANEKDVLVEKLSLLKSESLHNMLIEKLAASLDIDVNLRSRTGKKYTGKLMEKLSFCHE
jgi:tetratricopeptide (TPR) repeat protein